MKKRSRTLALTALVAGSMLVGYVGAYAIALRGFSRRWGSSQIDPAFVRMGRPWGTVTNYGPEVYPEYRCWQGSLEVVFAPVSNAHLFLRRRLGKADPPQVVTVFPPVPKGTE